MKRPTGKLTPTSLFSKLRLTALLFATLGTAGMGTSAAAAATGTSHAQIFTALEEQVICGIAAHVPGSPREVLCSNLNIPAPKHVGATVGDPGFVFLAKTGKPKPARLSQYSWQAPALNHRSALSGGMWSSGSVGVTCAVTRTSVKCTNRSGHGFTLTAHSYKAF
jgi:hypothetical protein